MGANARLIAVAAAVGMLAEWAVAQSSGPLLLYPALMDTLVGSHYEAARAICDSIDKTDPKHPAGYYARAAVCYAHMVDFEDTVGRGEFMAMTDSCMHACDAQRSTGNSDLSVIAYLKGSALAARGLLLNHEGRLLPALRALIRAKGEFDNAIEANPVFYDAYLGRGAYRYAVATHASMLKWLPFIPSRDSGWQDLWLAVARSKFSRSTAMTSIVWHEMDEGNYAAADTIIQSQLVRFPGCRNFLWPRLAFYERQERWAEAEQTAKLLLNQYLAHPDNNGYEAIGLYWRMMTCADALNRPEDAIDYARAGLATYRTPDVARRRTDKLHELQERLSNP
jgi:tetratricopeptide (TPR) repeat protein